MKPEERAKLESKGLEEQKIKEAPSEMTPEWHLYCDLEGDPRLLTKSYWLQLVASKFEEQAGDEADRWEALKKSIRLTEVRDKLEEYDGLNH